MEHPCNEHEKSISHIEAQVDSHHEELTTLRQRMHELSNTLASVEAILRRMEIDHSESKQEFGKHMANEEAAFRKMYGRLKSMDDELKDAFKQRDDDIHRIDKRQAVMLAYATAAFTVVTLLIQFVK